MLLFLESHILPFDFRHLADSINRAYAAIKEKELMLNSYIQMGMFHIFFVIRVFVLTLAFFGAPL